MNWIYKSFEQLNTLELYSILLKRQEVFVIEQECIYPDIDELDRQAGHLFAWDQQQTEICAYLRILAPGINYEEPSMGRVLSSRAARGAGIGRQLISEAIRIIQKHYPKESIKISAQTYLTNFYEEFGFATVSEPYDEDGIEHIDMLLESP